MLLQLSEEMSDLTLVIRRSQDEGRRQENSRKKNA
jgi:hypothetical protein